MTVNVLFICLGNICRSPMAEGIFQHLVDEAGLSERIQVDSAGTGSWHIGEPPHPGTQAELARHGITYAHRARQVNRQDMQADDSWIIALDASNVRDLERRFGEHPNLHRLLDFAPQFSVRDVPDPYYTDNFERVYQLVEAGCRGLLAAIREKEDL